MAISQRLEQCSSSILDALYCEEEQWELVEEEEEDDRENELVGGNNNRSNGTKQNPLLLPPLFLEQKLFCEDKDLISLFSKEIKQGNSKLGNFDASLSSARKEAVEWILMVNAHYGFCTHTSILAVDYLDRFFSSFHFHKDKPWTMQLAAVSCLSLAAKVEETYVPLLIDLQVEGTKYMFEAKDIQKMELLVLSTLEWKMNPVTPLSFLDHIIRRLGLKNHLHWEFLRQCEGLLSSVLPDWRFVSYLPSALATATMMHAIDQIEPCNPLEYQNQLLGVLNVNKEKVKECYQMMVEISTGNGERRSKRKLEEVMKNGSSKKMSMPSSPSGVIDASSCLSCDSSNDSWAATSPTTSAFGNNNHNNTIHVNVNVNVIGLSLTLPSSSSSSSWGSSSPVTRSGKKRRVKEQAMPLQLPSMCRLFVDVIGNGSPR